MLPGEQLARCLERQGFTGIAEAGSPVCVLLLGGIPLATAKFGADDSRSDGTFKDSDVSLSGGKLGI